MIKNLLLAWISISALGLYMFATGTGFQGVLELGMILGTLVGWNCRDNVSS